MADVKLKSIKFPDLPDRYVIPTDANDFTYDGESLADVLDSKADNDGSYSNMTVGNAEQLVSNVKVNDKTPYLFRTSGGSVDIGDREYVNGIVGGTVAWNQLWDSYIANPFNTVSATENVAKKDYTLTSTAQGTSSDSWKYGIRTTLVSDLIEGHKFLLSADLTASFDTSVRFVLCGEGYISNALTANAKNTVTKIMPVGNTTGISKQIEITFPSMYSQEVGATVRIQNAQAFDLTQMFGSTIADYIYSLETATAGAGVAWFKKLFNKPYYAYDAGSLKSVEGLVSHDMTGFNQFDGEWESGGYNHTTGAKEASNAHHRSVNYIKVVPNTSYYIKQTPSGSVRSFFYDADKQFISTRLNDSVTTPQDAYYMTLAVGNSYYPQDVNVNISWDGSRNGEYEPYELHSYPLDSDLTLRGIPKLDANNSLYYDGDTYASDGTVTRKYGIVDLGTLMWSKQATSSGNYRWSAGLTNVKASVDNNTAPNFICAKYKAITPNESYLAETGITSNTSNNVMFVSDATLNDNTGAQTATALSGVYLVYEFATPTTETADAYVGTQIVSDFGTEEFVIDSDITVPIPVGTDTDYPVNLVAKLEMAPNSPSDGNGDYILRQTNGINEYVPLVIEDALPAIPSTAGSYKLTVTVTEGSDPVLSWEAE